MPSAREKLSRPMLERMLRIHDELQRGTGPNCTRLVKLLEVSRKTVVRDIAFMRDRLDLPVEYDAVGQLYFYSHPVKSFPTVQVTEGELLALLVARKALEQYQGTPFHRQLAIAFDKLTAGLQDTISFSPAEELSSVSFKNIGLGKADLTLFNQLNAAVLKSQEVEFEYRKPGDKQDTHRLVRPYHLAHRENLWYLVGHDNDRGEIRTFAVPRMRALKVTRRTFERPADFSPEKFFSSAFGVLVGEAKHKVVVRFSALVADRVRERVWHESQEMQDLPDGSLELTLHLGALAEAERWILGWGEQAMVMSPKELKTQIEKTASVLAQRYHT